MSLFVKNLTLQRHKKILCENLNFHLTPGKILGVLGPNGSGKSTLLQTLAGLLSPSFGDIQIHGQCIRTIPSKTRAKKIGILFQNHSYFFSDTVFEFCSQGRYPHVDYFARENALDNKIIHHILTVMDLMEMKNKRIDTLSGGEKKRLEVATLLIQDPQIFLLDEPTNHVDLHYQMRILKYFQKLKSDKTIIIATHDICMAEQFCDDILLLYQHGKYLLGEKREILTSENLSLLYQYPMIKLHPHGFAPLY